MVDSEPRLSAAGLKVLRYFLSELGRRRSGAEIASVTKVGSGTLYPLLARLESAGWLSSEWETLSPSELGRPRKRFYQLTGLGQSRARTALSDVQIATGALAWNG
jgi:PadR family transcriptional regulator, regulatory protein PadR